MRALTQHVLPARLEYSTDKLLLFIPTRTVCPPLLNIMKSCTCGLLFVLLILLSVFSQDGHAFTFCPNLQTSGGGAVASQSTSTTQLFLLDGLFGEKDDGSPGDYVCKDCGYVFTKGPKAWAALPDNYSCPPCKCSL